MSRGVLSLCSPIRSHHIRFQWLIIFLDYSQISCSLQMYPSPSSSENNARILALACSAFFMLWNQLCSTVSSIWLVIVKSITSLSGNSLQVSQTMPFPHGDLSINQDFVSIVDNAVHNRLENRAAVIKVILTFLSRIADPISSLTAVPTTMLLDMAVKC